MQEYIKFYNHSIDKSLHEFICKELKSEKIKIDKIFWKKLSNIFSELENRRISLIEKRSFLQNKITNWHKKNKGKFFNKDDYKNFLFEIGYIVKENKNFKINTAGIDPEISSIPGPQLVVPLSNKRYAINAANSRWGSLYDALYGTDIIPYKGKFKIGEYYNESRGKEVIKYAKNHLDMFFPIDNCSYQDVTKIQIINNEIIFHDKSYNLKKMRNPNQFCGYIGIESEPEEIILKKNGLRIRLQIDNKHPIGKIDSFHLKDIVIESALSVIMDCEDSIVSVDTDDKIATFRNWMGLLDKTIKTKIKKDNVSFVRKLSKDILYKNPNGEANSMRGLSLLLIRNVGHLMTSSSILDHNKNEIGEGIIDTLLTALCFLKNINSSNNSEFKSLYIVKPKMHGPEEVEFSVDTFSKIEELLGLPENTIKIGIMDEERRTTLNLKECIRAAKNRVFFINTGFLDRTGDEIHTSMDAGTMIKKTEMKNVSWLQAYEKWNVEIGLKCGFSGLAQIGKGMWAMPDMMSKMMEEKIVHCESGANTAWVPSPTAATLHALHYHKVDVMSLHKKNIYEERVTIDDLIDIPIIDNPNWTVNEIKNELENNIQGILGYVVKWINNGIGCSKVPDINNVGLMEDRATLRISSQHIANWLHHGICNKSQVLDTFRKMATIVDKQNEHDPDYIPMSKDFDKSIAFQTAVELVLMGKEQPSGYTEPILHNGRLKFKNNFK